MQYLSVVLPLAAMVSGAFAGPAWSGKGDACLAAVTGSAALGDAGIRASHCASYLATTVTPIVTETVTITGKGNDNWKRATVALCPNEVPNYASACDDSAYSSACSRFGYTDVLTTTIDPTTTTKTIWVKPTFGAASCSATTVTVGGATTVTSTAVKFVPTGGPGSTVTVVKDGSFTWTATTVTVSVVTPTTVVVTKDGPFTWTASTVTVSVATPTTVTVSLDGSVLPTATTVTVTLDGSVLPTATTVTVATATPTTVFVTLDGSVSVTATTVTVATPTTVTVATPTTVTITADAATPTGSDPPSSCNVDDALATTLVANFVDLLQYTSYNGTQGAPGRGYHYNVSAVTLAEDFIDISDSINFMAGFPLGTITFNGKDQFDYGQGVLQPEVGVNVLNIWHDCNSITWRWQIYTLPYPVTGINHFLVNDDGLVQKNYAEFDSAAWLQSFGQSCAINAPPAPVSPPALKRSLLKN